MFEQSRRKPDGGGGMQPAVLAQGHGLAERQHGPVQEDGGAIDAENFTQKQQELFEHGLGIQGMREDGRKIAQDAEGLRRVDRAGGSGFRRA